MNNQKTDRFVCGKQDTSEANSDRQPVKNSPSSTGKPTSVWESPEFEEFDLCMEVTAYVHQWK